MWTIDNVPEIIYCTCAFARRDSLKIFIDPYTNNKICEFMKNLDIDSKYTLHDIFKLIGIENRLDDLKNHLSFVKFINRDKYKMYINIYNEKDLNKLTAALK